MTIQLHGVDISIIVGYMLVTVVAGLVLTRMAAKNMDSYFLGGRSVPWYFLGVANASGMFDIAGTMLMVTWVFVYGLKGALIPWMWPIFNQIFLMVFLSIWLRRSGVMTGAEWIRTRFGTGRGAQLSDVIVVCFALISTVAFLAYAFKGIGKFAQIFLPWQLTENQYGLIIMGATSLYVVLGGMFGVLVTNLIQFALLTIASIFIGVIAMQRTTAAQIEAVIPEGWLSLGIGWNLGLDWGAFIPAVNGRIATDGFSLFGILFTMMLLKGVLVSLAGPAPNYDMQRILSARNPREASLMSFIVSVVLLLPRYMMIGGICVLALVFFSDNLNAMETVDFEQILPFVISEFIPVGLVGLVLAGLLAAFMSTFSGTVNCGASYIVNDIYKRYIHPHASNRRYVIISYISSILIVVAGIAVGMVSKSIHNVTQWIVAGLWGGYTVPNMLKWYWWRMNGYGYFWGMVGGIVPAMALAVIFKEQPVLGGLEKNMTLFPFILLTSAVGTVVGSLATHPDPESVLKDFYRKVRPWGFWGPIHALVVQDDPGFQKNTNFGRDMINVAVGIIWQLGLTVIPLYLVLRQTRPLFIWIGVVVVTSVFLKINWYNKMDSD